MAENILELKKIMTNSKKKNKRLFSLANIFEKNPPPPPPGH